MRDLLRCAGNSLHSLVLAATLALTLAGCGGGGGGGGAGGSSPSPLPDTVVVSGIVYDDPIEGATVTLISLADNSVLATAVTGSGGSYSTPPIIKAQLGSGYQVVANGGTMLGKAFVGTLKAVYGPNVADYAVSNINLATTIVVKQAEALNPNEPLLARVANVAASWKSLGKLDSDVSIVPITDPTYQWFRDLAMTLGKVCFNHFGTC